MVSNIGGLDEQLRNKSMKNSHGVAALATCGSSVALPRTLLDHSLLITLTHSHTQAPEGG